MRVGWLAVAVLLAGCSQPGTEEQTEEPVPAIAPTMEYTTCPPSPASVPDAWSAPGWRVGDYWNYTVWRGDEVEGWENATVAAIGPVGAVTECAYHLEVRSTSKFAGDETHPDGGAMNTGTHTYDARTLNRVWDERPDCGYWIGDCFGSSPWPYGFPMADGQRWEYTSGGDAVSTLYASVEVTGSKDTLRLDVSHSDEEGEPTDPFWNTEVYHYSPLAGNAVAWERMQSEEVVERKVLDTYRFQASEGFVY